MAPARRSLVQQEPTARWVSYDGSGSSRRPQPLPAFEIWLTEQREQHRVLFERAWARRRRRRYRKAVRRHVAALAAWRHDDPGGPERWKFICPEAERVVSAGEYRSILEAQARGPCLILETLEGARWWMFADRFYVSDAELGAQDVTAALAGGRAEPPPAVNGRDQRRRPAADPSPAPLNGTPRETPAEVRRYIAAHDRGDLPPEVRRYVTARDRGRCAACGDDGPDLRVDPATLRLVCADCIADG